MKRDEMMPYRIGLGSFIDDLRLYAGTRRWPEFRCVLLSRGPRAARHRSWWGLWQAEWDGCQRAVRGLTKRSTYRRAVRTRARREAPDDE